MNPEQNAGQPGAPANTTTTNSIDLTPNSTGYVATSTTSVNPTPPPPPPAPPAPAKAKDDGEAPVTYTQEQVNKIAAREKNDGRRGVLEELKELGLESLDDVKAIIADRRKAEEAAMTDAERARAQAQREAEQAAADRAEAARLLREASITAALSTAGITGTAQRQELGLLVAAKMSADTDLDVNGALAAVKATFPQLFEPAPSSVPPPSGDVRGGTPQPNTGAGSAWDRGVALAEQENKRAGVGFDAETFSLDPGRRPGS